MDTYVLDACSVIAFFQKEPGFEKVKELFQRSRDGDCRLYMNKVNVLEIYYGYYRDDSPEVAESFYKDILLLPVEIIETLEDPLFREAARFKATCRVSLADSIALAEAKIKNAYLVTSDHHEFDVIEKKKEVNFYWIR